jgi:hypothetical protein
LGRLQAIREVRCHAFGGQLWLTLRQSLHDGAVFGQGLLDAAFLKQ